jgi:predicted Zn-dependent peptidase
MYQHTFPNGLTLLAEQMDHVRSATFFILVPAGFTHEPSAKLGTASALAELLTRGAGSRDSRELSLALDNLGTDRSESTGPFNLIFSAGTLARNLASVLEIYADIIRRPHLPEDELASAVELMQQDLLGLEDSPQDKVLLELKSRYYPEPLNRNRYGTASGLENLTPESIREFYRNRCRPDGAIISVAGSFNWPELKAQVERLFGDWSGTLPPRAKAGELRPSVYHIQKETKQTQISLAFKSAPIQSEETYAARGAVGVLSAGMSARLFTEVREKRGLCYSVYASYDSIQDLAAIVGYAGTSADRAQQTLDVMLAEFKRLSEGIADDEVQRVQASLKTSLVMQQESTSARASSMASDWFYLTRVRSLEEIQSEIDKLSPAKILAYLEKYPVKDVAVVTLGPQPLQVPAL